MIVIRIMPFSLPDIGKVIDAMTEIPGCCDEVWLSIYGYVPIETHRRQAAQFVPIVERLREAGYRPVIEIGSNLGHGDTAGGDPSVLGSFEKMTGADGFTAQGAFCPAGPAFTAYQCDVISAYASVRPYAFYLDDDLRIDYHGRCRYGCFCDRCIAEFNEKNGSSYTRDEIARLMLTDAELREKYINMNREHLAGYAAAMTRAAMSVSPESYMGWEYVLLNNYNGGDFRYVFDAMREASGKPPLSRPGCMFYQDHNPRLMLDKVINTSYQNAVAPAYVKVRRPEIENISHTVMGKSVAGTCVESTLNLAYGCNGLSYSMISGNSEPLEVRKRMWKAFAAHRGYWQGLISDTVNTGVCGVWLAAFPDMCRAVINGDSVSAFKWAEAPMKAGRDMLQTGLPLSYEKDFCEVSLLHPDMVDYLSDGDISSLLSSNVITDGAAVTKLRARGYILPVSAVSAPNRRERYTAHPANGVLAGGEGVVDSYTQGVYFHTLVPVEDAADAVEVLAETPGGASCVIAHTASGGSWGIVGSSLWCIIVNSARRLHTILLADYLSGGLPAYLESAEQAAVIPRSTRDGRFKSVTLLNLTIGETLPLSLVVKRPVYENFVLSRPGTPDAEVCFVRDGDAYRLVLPPLGAWNTATVRAV